VHDSKDRYGLLCSSVWFSRSRAAALAGQDAVPPRAPGADPGPTVAERWPVEEQRRLADEFLASPHASELRDPVSRMVPFLYVSTCVNQLGCDPLLVGPLLLGRVLMDVLPATLIAPDRFADAIPPFVRAWTEWLVGRHDLPARQRRKLTLSLGYLLRRFPEAWQGPAATPLRRYVQDLPDEVVSSGDAMFPVIERRTFAVPEPGKRADGTAGAAAGGHARHADELDAADERDRKLITLLGLSARGLPQQSFAPYLAVAEQLWTGEPPAPAPTPTARTRPHTSRHSRSSPPPHDRGTELADPLTGVYRR
jgi:hypothetical protein